MESRKGGGMFDAINTTLNGLVWGPPMMILLVGTGMYLTLRLCFIQFRGFRHGFRVLGGAYDSSGNPGEISHFQALSAALAATIGVGNIVGVASAILLGGPGAVFWMWITAVFGMATKYSSCLLAVLYRKVDERGESHCGPMHYIELGMGRRWKWLAVLFAVFTMIASFGIGNMSQVNSLVVNAHGLLVPEGDPEARSGMFSLVAGLMVAGLTGAVIVGGIKSIGRVAALLVPFMGLTYVLVGLWILLRHAGAIPEAFSTILHAAFHAPGAVEGGLIGGVIQEGVARGLFSNEAGLGSAPIAHGAARTGEPVREGLVAMLGPFIDTLVVCSITALVIVITGATGHTQVDAQLTAEAFSLGLGSDLGASFVSFSILLFAFSTLIGWSYYGDRAADYLFGHRAVMPYRLVFVLMIVVGACIQWDTILSVSDTMNGLMAAPNLIALVVLSPVVASATASYWRRLKGE